MTKNKEILSDYWVKAINKFLTSLNFENIKTEEFNNLVIQNTDDKINISVICNNKMLVLNLNESTSKFTGGWKYF